MTWHALAIQALGAALQSDPGRGLEAAEAAKRLARDGANALPEQAGPSALSLLLRQFGSLIVWVLIGAALVSGLLQEWVDAAAIVAIVVLNAALGFFQEFKAERSLQALKRLATVTARVIRGGVPDSLPAELLVCGDLIQIEAGDRVPADARLVYATALQTQEASLTGESAPVVKSADPIAQEEIALGDRHNMLYMGTVVSAGKGRALVVGTGLRTELGRIAMMLQKAESGRMDVTTLQRRLDHLGYVLLYASLGIVAVVFLLGLWRGEPLLGMFQTAVSLAVAAIPEGLPAIVTITLALGVTRMVRRHALIRRLPAVETLGSTTVICSDKTGTLTKNEMSVTALYQGREVLAVSGEGYAPVGDVLSFGQPVKVGARPGLEALLRASVLCNGAELRQEAGAWTILGDVTEGALLVAAAKADLRKEELERDAPFLGEIPFDSERKKMTIVRRTASGPVAFIKGAPDVLLRDCREWLAKDGATQALTDDSRREILAAIQNFASQGLRVLGVAMRPLGREPEAYGAAALERDLIFLGLMGMQDPIRPEVRAAVEVCRVAGVRTVMITGDHEDTAVAIARELGILEGETHALSGADLDRLNDDELVQQVERIAVYARVSAAHKLRIVRAWQKRGAVVAMTGDGVNDAPALKAADIGVAMGITGTEVSKEASAMVVTDDNFASIAAAIEEGRSIYENILKSIRFLLSVNTGLVLLVLLTTLLELPLPLLPVQILWINLVTNGLPALALAMDPRDPDLMRRPPRRPQARILERDALVLMFGQGLFMALVAIATFAYCLYGMDRDLERARTLTFMVLVGLQLGHAFNCRSDRLSLFALGLWTNKPLLWAVGGSALLQTGLLLNPWTREVFRLATFDAQHWLLAFGVGSLMVVAMEIWKTLRAGRARSSA